jgi:glutamate racemase
LNRLFEQAPDIDTLLLACTHYPLLMDKIRAFAPASTTILSQGNIVATSLKAYLERHPEMEQRCSKNGSRTFYTTDSVQDFNNHASLFFGEKLESKHLELL